ncbi:MAG: hypothetical protein IJO32_00010 [Bacilli bacterium]|nr:hypothetical protein [Bacilli bacterium]
MDTINNFKNKILKNLLKKDSAEIIISGNDYASKTYLLKEILLDLKKNFDVFSFYLENKKDIFSNSNFLHYLLLVFYSYSPECSINNITDDYSLKKYIKKTRVLNHISKQLLRNINVAGAHVTGTAPNIINDSEYAVDYTSQNGFDLMNYIIKYLYRISKKKKIVICIDNFDYDEKSIVNIFLIELLNKLKRNLFLIISPSESFSGNYIFKLNPIVEKLDCFSENQIIKILNSKYHFNEKETIQIANWIASKTNGVIIDTINVINENNEAFIDNKINNFKIQNISEMVNSLDSIQKNLIFISNIFPNGLSKKLLYNYFSNYESIDELTLDNEINELIKRDIMFFNGENGDSLKLLNKAYGKNLNMIISSDHTIEYLQSIKMFISNCLEEQNMQNYEYSYLLHCIIFLYKSNELENNIDKFIKLINLEYSFMSYHYISNIYEKIYQIIHIIPMNIIIKILDSFQKCSEFEKGLSLIQKLKSINVNNDQLKIYEAKYLTQLYEYDAALKIIDEIKDKNGEYYYTKLNILQQQFDKSAVLDILNEVRLLDNKDKWYYIILRNTTHYFNFETAYNNLKESMNYFDKYKFEKATILNNMGIILLGNNNILESKKCFDESINILKQLNSNEIFEPYCNRAIYYLLSNEEKQCIQDIKNAKKYVPLSLKMDHILIDINSYIIKLFFKKISLPDVIFFLTQLLENQIADKWTEFLIKYNLSNLSNKKLFDDKFKLELDDKSVTHFEIFIDVEIDNTKYNLLLGLSPNWRY